MRKLLMTWLLLPWLGSGCSLVVGDYEACEVNTFTPQVNDTGLAIQGVSIADFLANFFAELPSGSPIPGIRTIFAQSATCQEINSAHDLAVRVGVVTFESGPEKNPTQEFIESNFKTLAEQGYDLIIVDLYQLRVAKNLSITTIVQLLGWGRNAAKQINPNIQVGVVETEKEGLETFLSSGGTDVVDFISGKTDQSDITLADLQQYNTQHPLLEIHRWVNGVAPTDKLHPTGIQLTVFENANGYLGDLISSLDGVYTSYLQGRVLDIDSPDAGGCEHPPYFHPDASCELTKNACKHPVSDNLSPNLTVRCNGARAFWRCNYGGFYWQGFHKYLPGETVKCSASGVPADYRFDSWRIRNDSDLSNPLSFSGSCTGSGDTCEVEMNLPFPKDNNLWFFLKKK